MIATIKRYLVTIQHDRPDLAATCKPAGSSVVETRQEVVVLHADHLASHQYDEAEERALFNGWYTNGCPVAGVAAKLAAWAAWSACANSRAKAAGCE